MNCEQQAAFPAQEKRVDALILCTTEIFIYLEENLKLTPDTLSDKVVAKDELEEMHQQVCFQTLPLGFCFMFVYY